MLLPAQTDLAAAIAAGVSLFAVLGYLSIGGRTLWVVVTGGIVTLVLAVAAVVTIGFTCRVVTVSGTSQLDAERSVLLGSSTVELGAGKQATLGTGDAQTLIVNATERTLTVHGATYGWSGGPQPRPFDIAPHTAVPFDGFLDYLGPSEGPLPRSVSSKTSSTTKYWLTW